MHVRAGMLLEDFHGAVLVREIPRSHPQEEAATFDLFLQMVAVLLAEPLGEERADQAAGSAA